MVNASSGPLGACSPTPAGRRAARPRPDPAGGGGRAEAAVAHGAAAHEPALCPLGEIVLPATAREQSRPAGVDARIPRAEALMAADPGAPHTIRSLAGEVSLSPSRFAHFFAEQLGRCPVRQRYGSPSGAYRTGLRTQRSLNSGRRGNGTLPEFPP